MLKEKVGMVTEQEKNEIKALFERKNALNELLMTLSNPEMSEQAKNDLYERIVGDISRTKASFDKWWSDMSNKYQWKSVKNANWNIDFETNEISLQISA